MLHPHLVTCVLCVLHISFFYLLQYLIFKFVVIFLILVSLALRVRVKRGVITRSTASLWTQYLTNMSHQLSMNEQQIDELKFGLEFGKAIELPPEVFFSTTQICDMLISKNSVRYFSHLKLAQDTINA